MQPHEPEQWTDFDGFKPSFTKILIVFFLTQVQPDLIIRFIFTSSTGSPFSKHSLIYRAKSNQVNYLYRFLFSRFDHKNKQTFQISSRTRSHINSQYPSLSRSWVGLLDRMSCWIHAYVYDHSISILCRALLHPRLCH